MGSEKLNKHILVGIKQEAMHPFFTKESVHSKTLYPQELARSKAKAAALLKAVIFNGYFAQLIVIYP